MNFSALAGVLATGIFVSGAALALDAAAPAEPPKLDAAARLAKLEECMREADVKGLHSRERRKFREDCMKSK